MLIRLLVIFPSLSLPTSLLPPPPHLYLCLMLSSGISKLQPTWPTNVSQLPVLGNKVLSEHSHTHSLCSAYGCFHVWMAELSNYNRDHLAHRYLLLLLLSSFSHVRLCATPEMAAHQAPPSPGFSRQEHWSGLPFPSLTHESEVAQLCQTGSDPMDCSLPGPSFPGIFQARGLEWVAIAFSDRYLLSGPLQKISQLLLQLVQKCLFFSAICFSIGYSFFPIFWGTSILPDRFMPTVWTHVWHTQIGIHSWCPQSILLSLPSFLTSPRGSYFSICLSSPLKHQFLRIIINSYSSLYLYCLAQYLVHIRCPTNVWWGMEKWINQQTFVKILKHKTFWIGYLNFNFNWYLYL